METRDKLLLPTLLESGWDDERGRLTPFRKSPYYEQLMTAYADLRVDLLYQSGLHGPGHIERVLLLGALIARNEGLSPADARLLLRCCAYHDLGRVDDWEDPEHGARSASMLASEAFAFARQALSTAELPILYAAVAAHSRSGKHRCELGERYGVSPADFTRYEEIAACLKDADNLDRVRLHDLDPSRLRHEESLALIPLAEELYRKYRELAGSTV